MSTQRSWVIVVGYDGSEPSARCARRRGATRTPIAASIYVVHAVELPPDFLGSPNYQQMLTERMDRGRERWSVPALVTKAEPGPEYVTELIGGPPAKAIADVASARDADVDHRGCARPRPRPRAAGQRLSRTRCTSPTGRCW